MDDLPVGSHSPVPPIHSPPPWLIDKDRANAYKQEETTYATADDLEVVSDGSNSVPEGPLRLCNVLYERQNLDNTDECGYKYCYAR